MASVAPIPARETGLPRSSMEVATLRSLSNVIATLLSGRNLVRTCDLNTPAGLKNADGRALAVDKAASYLILCKTRSRRPGGRPGTVPERCRLFPKGKKRLLVTADTARS